MASSSSGSLREQCVRLGLHVEGVIGRMYCSGPSHKLVDPDFSSFALMYKQHHGMENLFVISDHAGRSVAPISVRICRAAGLSDLGMSEDIMSLVKHPLSKGPTAVHYGLTHLVDHEWGSLISEAKHAKSTLRALILYDNNSPSDLDRARARRPSFDFGDIEVYIADSWARIAEIVGIPSCTKTEWLRLRNLTPFYRSWDPND